MSWPRSRVSATEVAVAVPDSARHDVRTIADTVSSLRAAYPSVAGIGWDFDGFRVWVDSNDPALLRALANYFACFRRLAADSLAAARADGLVTHISAIELATPPDFGAQRTMTIGEYKPSVKGPKEAYFDVADGRVVHKLRTGVWFLFGRDDHLAIGPCLANPNQVINFINNRMIQWALHRGALLGHAAAVCRADETELPRTIVIAGRSGMGKSTLSLRMMNDRRLDFLSNDRAMLHRMGDDRLEVEGVPKHPRINPGTILNNDDLIGLLDAHERERFAAMPNDELWQLEHKYDGVIERCFPKQRFRLRGRLVGLVLLNWTRGAGPTVARRLALRDAAALLPALMKSPGVFYMASGQSRPHRLESYLGLLDGLPTLELDGGIDFDAGYRAALELLDLHAP
jgi:HprK-related kinase B